MTLLRCRSLSIAQRPVFKTEWQNQGNLDTTKDVRPILVLLPHSFSMAVGWSGQVV